MRLFIFLSFLLCSLHARSADPSQSYALYCAQLAYGGGCAETPEEAADRVIDWLQANDGGTGRCYESGSYYDLIIAKRGPLMPWYPQNPGQGYEQEYVRLCNNVVQYTSTFGLSGVLHVDRFHDKPTRCGFGNPVFPLTGSKQLQIDLGPWLSLPLQLGYDTRKKVPTDRPHATFSVTPPPSFGGLWESNVHKRFVMQSGGLSVVQVSRGLGRWVSFSYEGGQPRGDLDVADRFFDGAYRPRYDDVGEGRQEEYTAEGLLLRVQQVDGKFVTYAYSDTTTPLDVAPLPGLLIGLGDQSGRRWQLAYESSPVAGAPPRVKTLTARRSTADVSTTRFFYDEVGRLAQLVWPDGSIRRFLYEDPRHDWQIQFRGATLTCLRGCRAVAGSTANSCAPTIRRIMAIARRQELRWWSIPSDIGTSQAPRITPVRTSMRRTQPALSRYLPTSLVVERARTADGLA